MSITIWPFANWSVFGYWVCRQLASGPTKKRNARVQKAGARSHVRHAPEPPVDAPRFWDPAHVGTQVLDPDARESADFEQVGTHQTGRLKKNEWKAAAQHIPPSPLSASCPICDLPFS